MLENRWKTQRLGQAETAELCRQALQQCGDPHSARPHKKGILGRGSLMRKARHLRASETELAWRLPRALTNKGSIGSSRARAAGDCPPKLPFFRPVCNSPRAKSTSMWSC